MSRSIDVIGFLVIAAIRLSLRVEQGRVIVARIDFAICECEILLKEKNLWAQQAMLVSYYSSVTLAPVLKSSQ